MSDCPNATHCAGMSYLDDVCDATFDVNRLGEVDVTDYVHPTDGPIFTTRILGHNPTDTFEDNITAHTEKDKVRNGCTDPWTFYEWVWGHVWRQGGSATPCDTRLWMDMPTTSQDPDAWGVFACYQRDYITGQLNRVIDFMQNVVPPTPVPGWGSNVSNTCAGAVFNEFGYSIARDYLGGAIALQPYPGISVCELFWFTGGVSNACAGHPGTAKQTPAPVSDNSEFPFSRARELCQQEMIALKPVADGWRVAHGETPYPAFTPTP